MSEYFGNIFKTIIDYCTSRSFSKWVVMLYDMTIVLIAFAVVVLFGCRVPDSYPAFDSFAKFVMLLLLYLLSFFAMKPYHGIIRHAGMSDVFQIIKSNLLVLFLYSLLKMIVLFVPRLNFYLLPFFEMMFQVSFVSILMITGRFVVKYYYHDFDLSRSNSTSNVVIYGAGSVGVLVSNALKQDDFKNRVVAFLDDNPNKTNKSIDGTPILSVNEVLTSAFVGTKKIDMIILAMPDISDERRKEIIGRALNLKLKIKMVPKIETWINDNFSTSRLQNIKIEDLLDRNPIVLDDANIDKEIDNKVIMVTGAAGSVGSEIVRQIILHNPRKVVALDQAESPMFDLQFDLKNSVLYKKFSNRVVFEIADVKDEVAMDIIFARYKPDVIYHAAAYKHVPLMEDNPYEAVLVNVFGTKVLVEKAIKYETGKFVMISTDKAVYPTNVMGATKRLAEIFVQSRSSQKTSFVTTRFGNVLGSNGSVIPLFRKQLDLGGPLTVTHKDVFRYFMTLQEAASLVLEASAIGAGGDIFVFDMGKPVRIYDLAENMIRLSKAENVKIKEIGLRPGEKLYEELLSDKENTLPTKYPKILHAKVEKYEESYVDQQLIDLWNVLATGDAFKIVSKLKEIMPEYVSNNSKFSVLDKE